jgi:uridine kinase
MIIGISGGTGSGKTTIARKVIESVGEENVILIEQDSYYCNLEDIPLDERQKANFDHPEAIDFDLLASHLLELKNGNGIERPIYDFKSHTRSTETARLKPGPVLIIEGILIFAVPEIRNILDVRVFVDTPPDIRFIRRLNRDVTERGRTVKSVIKQYFSTVRPMHFQFVEPSKKYADIIIPDGGNPEVGIDFLSGKIREKLNHTGNCRETT